MVSKTKAPRCPNCQAELITDLPGGEGNVPIEPTCFNCAKKDKRRPNWMVREKVQPTNWAIYQDTRGEWRQVASGYISEAEARSMASKWCGPEFDEEKPVDVSEDKEVSSPMRLVEERQYTKYWQEKHDKAKATIRALETRVKELKEALDDPDTNPAYDACACRFDDEGVTKQECLTHKRVRISAEKTEEELDALKARVKELEIDQNCAIKVHSVLRKYGSNYKLLAAHAHVEAVIQDLEKSRERFIEAAKISQDSADETRRNIEAERDKLEAKVKELEEWYERIKPTILWDTPYPKEAELLDKLRTLDERAEMAEEERDALKKQVAGGSPDWGSKKTPRCSNCGAPTEWLPYVGGDDDEYPVHSDDWDSWANGGCRREKKNWNKAEVERDALKARIKALEEVAMAAKEVSRLYRDGPVHEGSAATVARLDEALDALEPKEKP